MGSFPESYLIHFPQRTSTVTLKRASVDGPIIPVMILIGVAAVGALRQLAQDLLLTTQKDAVVGILHILVKSSRANGLSSMLRSDWLSYY